MNLPRMIIFVTESVENNIKNIAIHIIFRYP